MHHVVFDRWPDHTPRTIFAGSTNAEGAQEVVAFRVSRRGELQRLTSFEADVRSLELKDVTGDGVPELFVTGIPGNRSTPVEILRWNGRDFEEIGEVSDHTLFVDLDGDGVPEAVEAGDGEMNECDARTSPTYVSKLKNGHFEEETPPNLLDVDTITKQTAAREAQRFYWFLPDDVATKCTIRVRKKGITSLRITMRELDSGDAGETIVLHDDPRRIELPSRCTEVDVTVTGPRGATAVLLLESR